MYRIFYGDGSTYDAEDGLPTGERARGVQAVLQDHPDVKIEIVTASDYYVMRDGRWHGVDIFGLFDYLLDSGIVLFGRTISREEYQAVMREALAQQKAGWLPGEIKPSG